MIVKEGGVKALKIKELIEACRARGMRAYGVSEDRLREQLKQWLEMSLNDKIPPSLLLLSSVFYLPENISFEDKMKTILAHLPTELAEQTRQKLTEIEGGNVGYKERLELLKSVEKSLAEERKLADKITEKKKDKEKLAIKSKEEKEKLEKAIETAEVKPTPIDVHF